MSVATAIERRGNTDRRDRTSIVADDGFEAIYDAYHGRIFGLAYRMMGNPDEALDVTQDAFVSAYLNLHKLSRKPDRNGETDVHLSAWLHRIAANKCIDALRKRKRQANVDWDLYARNAPSSEADGGHPEIYALGRERSEQVQRVLDGMTPNYRLVLLLQEYQGMSVREISRTIARSESAVKSMLFRAREQFRAIYELEGALDRAA